MIKTAEYSFCKFNFTEFNPVQETCYPFFEQDCNLVLSATTSAGKTAIAEAIFAYELFTKKDQKVIYVCPLKSVAEEKRNDWKKHPTFKDYNIAVISGDNEITYEEINESHIVIATVESLNVRCRRNEEWLSNVSCFVFDEAHMISQEDRGANCEALLMAFTTQNKACRLIFLSGTMPNTLEIAKWIKQLNGKKTQYLESKWRPNKIHKEILSVKNSFDLQEQIYEQINNNPGEKVLIFVHSKKLGELLNKFLKDKKIRCAFFCSGIKPEMKEKMLNTFSDEKSSLNVLIATSALEMGVNL
jgi:replicative superfamily II helicase